MWHGNVTCGVHMLPCCVSRRWPRRSEGGLTLRISRFSKCSYRLHTAASKGGSTGFRAGSVFLKRFDDSALFSSLYGVF